MDKISLSLAIGDYDHVRDITSGRVTIKGASVIACNLPPEEIFSRFAVLGEWDAAEMSMGQYISIHSRHDSGIIAIPVFVSRSFRHSTIFVRDDRAITSPENLRGKRIGLSSWTQTAPIYIRGMLAHHCSVPLHSVEWVQGGVDKPRLIDNGDVRLPPGVICRSESGCSLSDLLLAGKIDAILSTPAPRGYGKGIVRLFEDFEPVEEAYFRETGIFPIMHVLAIRKDVLDRHPWLAMNLYTAFEEAKRRSIERLSDITCSHVPFAWIKPYSDRMKRLFGADFWPYGVEKNRTTLEAFLQYGYEQGVCNRKLSPEDLFPALLSA